MIKTTIINGHEVQIQNDYIPNENDIDYMSVRHLAFFKISLNEIKTELDSELEDLKTQITTLSNEIHHGDSSDMASQSEELLRVTKILDRKRKYKDRVLETIKKIDTGDYGFCSKTGAKIGIQRLLLRPITNYCLEVQEQMEKEEKTQEKVIYQDQMRHGYTDEINDDL